MKGHSLSTLGALRAMLSPDVRVGLDYGSDDMEVIVLRDGEDLHFDIPECPDYYTKQAKRAERRNYSICSAAAAAIPDNPSRQVRRAEARRISKGVPR